MSFVVIFHLFLYFLCLVVFMIFLLKHRWFIYFFLLEIFSLNFFPSAAPAGIERTHSRPLQPVRVCLPLCTLWLSNRPTVPPRRYPHSLPQGLSWHREHPPFPPHWGGDSVDKWVPPHFLDPTPPPSVQPPPPPTPSPGGSCFSHLGWFGQKGRAGIPPKYKH